MNCAAGFLRWKRSLKPSAKNRRSERGWALISVLWVVALLAMLAAATQTLTLTAWRIEGRALRAAQAQALLDGAVAEAVAGITTPHIEERWRVDGQSRSITLDRQEIKVSVQDELGRIDLNMADGSAISQLLAAAGLGMDQAQALTDKILDWRDSSGLRRLHGANAADYKAAGYTYRPRNGPFRSVRELKLVMGMTPNLFAKIEPALTVYSHSPSLDPNTAPTVALEALYHGNNPQAQSTLAQRQIALPDSQDLKGILSPQVSLSGRAFAIAAELFFEGARYKRDEVIEVTGDPKRPYLVMYYN